MQQVAPTNEEAVEAWSGVLFDRWVALRDVVAGAIAPFSDEAYRICRPPRASGSSTWAAAWARPRCSSPSSSAPRVRPSAWTPASVSSRWRAPRRRRPAPPTSATSSATFRWPTSAGPTTSRSRASGRSSAPTRWRCFATCASSLAPGGRLAMIAWRRKLDNEWLHRGELVADRYLEKPEETDEPTCGPGPFSMANADTVTDQLKHAGYEEIAARRVDIDYRMGDDLDDALRLVMAIGPAGELIRLAGDEAEKIRPTARGRAARGLRGAGPPRRRVRARRRCGSTRRPRLSRTTCALRRCRRRPAGVELVHHPEESRPLRAGFLDEVLQGRDLNDRPLLDSLQPPFDSPVGLLMAKPLLADEVPELSLGHGWIVPRPDLTDQAAAVPH